jgi:poly-beta-1,6-N-acetyl-D-glucosamine biosynthesis protein PgaD
MGNPLIIENRSLVAWHRRVFSDVSTTLLWVWWIMLWKPVLHYGLHFSVLAIVSVGIMIDDRAIAYPLAGLCTILTLWNYVTKTSSAPTVPETINYAEHFDISEQDMLVYTNSKICVVHHDEHGKIVNIEAR